MAILQIYGARAIFLLFYDHQDTESESCETEMRIYQKIFTHKKSKAILGNVIHTLQDEREYLW